MECLSFSFSVSGGFDFNGALNIALLDLHLDLSQWSHE